MRVVLQSFPSLQSELAAISNAWSYDFIDCLRYIYDNRKEYTGTRCWTEFVEFTTQVGFLSGKE